MRNPPLQRTRPAFISRLREKSVPRLPRWIDWHSGLLLTALLMFGALLWVLSSILAPFLAAIILAYIFNPLVNWLAARNVSRTAGTVLAVLLLVIIVATLLVIVLPLFYKEISQLTALIPNFLEHLKSTVVPWLNSRLGIEIAPDPASFRQFMQDNLSDSGGIAKRVFVSVGTGGLAVVGILVTLALIPIVFFYVLRDWPLLVGNVNDMVPRRIHATVTGIAAEIDAVLSEFLRGQLLVMLIMAAFYVIGLWAVGLKFALPVGLITGLLVFVPYLGVGMGMVLGTVAAVIQFDALLGVALVWGVFGAGQIVESFFVTPKFVGQRIGLHPVAVIFALLAFGQVFGFFGVLLALPASAAILVGLRRLQARYRSSAVFSG
ncbi:MAG: AI-2E family transporter [Aeromicrobium sp.]|nr:AI-2E family transporter [Burkholderiales bacterium]